MSGTPWAWAGRRRSARCPSTVSAGFAMVSPKTALGVGAEGGLKLLVGAVRIDEGAFKTHAASWCGRAGCRCPRRWPRRPPRDRPLPAMLNTAKKFAAWPEEVSMAARAAFQLRRSSPPPQSLVGFCQARVEVAATPPDRTARPMCSLVSYFQVVDLVDGHLARLAVAGPPPALHAGRSNPLAHSGLPLGLAFFRSPIIGAPEPARRYRKSPANAIGKTESFLPRPPRLS